MNDLKRFYDVADQMDTFDRLSFSSDEWVGRVIRFFTKQNVNHTGAVMKIGGWIAIVEADPEVMTIDLGRKLREYKGSVYWHPLKKEFHPYREALGEKMRAYTGIKYDWAALFTQIFKRVRPNRKNMFCSEMLFLAGKFLKSTPLPIPKKFKEMAPQPGNDMDELGWWAEGVKII